MTFNFTRYYIAFPVAVFILASFFYISLGSIPNAFYGHDAVILLDEAWRIQNGQIPHHDFYLNIGSSYSYLCAFFIRLNHYDAIDFSWMNVSVTTICFLIMLAIFGFNNNPISGESNCRDITNNTLILLFILALGFGFYALGALVTSSLTACCIIVIVTCCWL